MANQEPLDALFASLADPTRRAIVARLTAGPASVGELAAPADMALPSFMKHLSQLERAGLIRSSKRGRVRTCELAPEGLGRARDWLDAQRRLWEGRTDRLAQLAEAMNERKTK